MVEAGVKVTAVVVTQDRPNDLKDCVRALMDQTLPLTAILVIDNAGPRALAAILPQDSRLTIIRHPINSGGAGGFHRGILEALKGPGQWFWLLDDDAIPRPNALERLLQGWEAESSENPNIRLSAVYEFGRLALRHRRLFHSPTGWEKSLSAHQYSRSWVGVDTGSFVGFLLPRAAALAVPLPQADFFLAFDDTDYSLRLKAAGFSLKLIPASAIDHRRQLGARLREGPFSGKHLLNIRNHLWVKRRHARWPWISVPLGLIYGLLVFLRSGGLQQPGGLGVFWEALQAAMEGRLGPPPLSIGRDPEKDHPGGLHVVLAAENESLATHMNEISGALMQYPELRIHLGILGVSAPPQGLVNGLEPRSQDRLLPFCVPKSKGAAASRIYNLGLRSLDEQPSKPLAVAFLGVGAFSRLPVLVELLKVLRAGEADVVHWGMSSQGAPSHRSLPEVCLLAEEVISLEIAIIRHSSLKRSGVLFDERLERFQGWSFLQRLLALGFRFEAVSLSPFAKEISPGAPETAKASPSEAQELRCIHEEQALLWPSLNGRVVLDRFLAFDASKTPWTPQEWRVMRTMIDKMRQSWPELMQTPKARALISRLDAEKKEGTS